ncbi:hypothetical protein EYF80_046045 [Liparis tanakae]|uniref:Uncharacterized protein n=1 Tax=Liparis tanakae TaxID=230148 RepID=A0A4Z2FST1_9TELE|nr:hypothetical protein EYF80_046045 [Liparis tanakae]
MDSQPMLPIHRHAHKHNGAIKYSEASLRGLERGERGAEREGLCVDTTGPLKKNKDATKMSPRSEESWMERLCFGIT